MENVVVIMDPTEFPDYAGRYIDFFHHELGLRTVCLYADSGSRLRSAGVERTLRSRSVRASYRYDPDDIPAIATALRTRYRVRAVVPQAEAVVVPAAELSEALELDWMPSQTMRRFRDKFALKEHLRAAPDGPRMNLSVLVQSVDDVRGFLAVTGVRQFVIKPNDGTGNSRIGFFDRDTGDEELSAFLAVNGTSPLVLEEWIGGEEYCVNGQVDGHGRVETLSVQRTVYFTANGRTNLAGSIRMIHADTDAFRSAAAYASQVLTTAGLRRSPFHMEIKIDDRGPCLIEVGARLGGAGIPYDTRLAHGGSLDLFALAGRNYLNLPTDDRSQPDWAAYDRRHVWTVFGVSETAATVRHLEGVDEVEAMPEFEYWVIQPRLGQSVRPTVDVSTIPWQVTLSASDVVDLERAEQRIRGAIRWNAPTGPLQGAMQQIRARSAWAGRRLKGVPELAMVRPRHLSG